MGKKKKSKKKRQSILNGKHRRGNLSLGKKRLSVENLIVHNQLKSKLMDAELEQMLSYINRMQFLVSEEKQRRIQSKDCCVSCNTPSDAFVLLLPCAHQNVCFGCSNNLKHCPVCKVKITQIIKPKK